MLDKLQTAEENIMIIHRQHVSMHHVMQAVQQLLHVTPNTQIKDLTGSQVYLPVVEMIQHQTILMEIVGMVVVVMVAL